MALNKIAFVCVFITALLYNAEAARGECYDDVLAYTSTPLINKSANRTDNIVLTCEKINETIVPPGGIFSFNQTVGNRTAERGFKAAPTFLNGQVADSIGGGICQVSSTLYYACLLSGLEIVSRTSHSMSPDYLESPGLDATVCWNIIDYQFKNNTDSPIKIFAWTGGYKVHVKITGTKTNHNTVEMESVIISSTPYETVYRENPHLAPGKTRVAQPAFTGYIVETYRVTKNENGEIISRVFEAKGIYKKMDKIIERNSNGA